jgi:hypothetical protein
VAEPRQTTTFRRAVVGGVVGAVAVGIVWTLLYDLEEAIVMAVGFFALMLAVSAWMHRPRRS